MPGFCFAARIATAPRCHPETIPGAQKQKIGSGCNFFAIADCRVVPIRRSRLKKCSKQLQNGPFFALWEWKRVRNRKKAAETSGFLFLRWAEIAVTRQTSRKNTRSRQRRQRQRFRLRVKPRSDRANLSLTVGRFRFCGGRVGGGASLGHASCIKEQTFNFEEWFFASVKLPSAQGVRERTAFLSVVHDFSDGLFPYYVHPANG